LRITTQISPSTDHFISFQIPPAIFNAQDSTAFRWNDILLLLSLKSWAGPRLGTSAENWLTTKATCLQHFACDIPQ